MVSGMQRVGGLGHMKKSELGLGYMTNASLGRLSTSQKAWLGLQNMGEGVRGEANDCCPWEP